MSRNLTRVNLIHNPHYKASGIKSYAYLLKKFNIGPTKEGPYFLGNVMQHQGKHGAHHQIGGRSRMVQHLQKRDSVTGDSGEVPADDVQNDSLYLAPVQIGTPAQTLNLDFDTGSADLWVWSISLPSATQTKGKASGHVIFDPKKSSTWKASAGESWHIQYGDSSSASGTVGTDNVSVGGLVIKQQAVEIANKISAQFISGTGDGLLGLAFGSINTVQPKAVATPVENMITQQDIPQDMELFTAHLGNASSSDTDESNSFYTFGYIDQTVLSAANVDASNIYYTPIDNSQGFWTFDSTSFSINGKTATRSGNTAIADTGTTLALVDDATVEAIYKAIPGSKYDSSQQGYIYPANTPASKLPVVAFAVGEQLFTVQKDDLGFADAGNGMVFGGIQSRGDNPFDILGDTFLKSIYAIFDQGNNRFGAVQRTDNSAPSTGASQAT